MTLHLGKSKMLVDETLGIKTNNIKACTDTNFMSVNVYLLTKQRKLSFNANLAAGKETIGKYVQLEFPYYKDVKVQSIESCSLCHDNSTATLATDFGKTFMFFKVTLPGIIFNGLKQIA